MNSLTNAVNEVLHGCKIKGVDTHGRYAKKIFVSFFNENPTLTIQMLQRLWVMADENNQTWLFIHKEYEFKVWDHINLLHTMSRDIVQLAIRNPPFALAHIGTVQHIFNAVMQFASHRKEIRDFLDMNDPLIDLTVDEKYKKDYEAVKARNPIRCHAILKTKCREADLKSIRIAFSEYGKYCLFYGIDPFPFDQGPIETIPQPVLSLAMKMKRLAWFWSENIS